MTTAPLSPLHWEGLGPAQRHYMDPVEKPQERQNPAYLSLSANNGRPNFPCNQGVIECQYSRCGRLPPSPVLRWSRKSFALQPGRCQRTRSYSSAWEHRNESAAQSRPPPVCAPPAGRRPGGKEAGSRRRRSTRCPASLDAMFQANKGGLATHSGTSALFDYLQRWPIRWSGG